MEAEDGAARSRSHAMRNRTQPMRYTCVDAGCNSSPLREERFWAGTNYTASRIQTAVRGLRPCHLAVPFRVALSADGPNEHVAMGVVQRLGQPRACRQNTPGLNSLLHPCAAGLITARAR